MVSFELLGPAQQNPSKNGSTQALGKLFPL